MPRVIGMIFADPSDAKTNGTVLIHLQVVGRTQWRRFIRIPQLLLGKIIELLVPAFRLARLLPEFVGASDNVHLGRLWHCLLSSEHDGIRSRVKLNPLLVFASPKLKPHHNNYRDGEKTCHHSEDFISLVRKTHF
jgi:hypothetical protein